jgi:hypothetical protein
MPWERWGEWPIVGRDKVKMTKKGTETLGSFEYGGIIREIGGSKAEITGFHPISRRVFDAPGKIG